MRNSARMLRRGAAVTAALLGALALSACTGGLVPQPGPAPDPVDPPAPVTAVMHPHGDASLWLDNGYAAGVATSSAWDLDTICGISPDGVVAGEKTTDIDTFVMAYDSVTGQQLWEHPAEHCVTGSSRAATMLVTRSTSTGRAVMSLNLREGTAAPLSGISGGPTSNEIEVVEITDEHAIYTETRSGLEAGVTVHAASLSTGGELWKRDFPQDTVCTMREGGIGCRGTSTLTVLNVIDGSAVLELDAVRENWFAPAVFWDASPASTAGKRTIRAFNGDIIGERPEHTSGDAPTVVPVGVMIDGVDGTLAPDAMVLAADGTIVWQQATVQVQDGAETVQTTPVGVTADGTVMLVSTERSSALVNTETGNVIAGPFRCEASVVASQFVCGGTVYSPNDAGEPGL